MSVHLLNLLRTTTLSHLSPFEILFNTAPTYDHLRVFGCLCYPNLSSTASHKLQPRSTACVFLGYSSNHKGYRCLDLSTNRVITSRHVIFNENHFPYSQNTPPLSSVSDPLLSPDGDSPNPLLHLVSRPNRSPPPVRDTTSPPVAPLPSASASRRASISSPPGFRASSIPSSPSPPPPGASPSYSSSATSDLVPNSVTDSSPSPSPVNEPFVSSSSPAPSHPMVTRSKSGIFKPRHLLNLSASHTPSISPLPRSYAQAIRDSNWKSAMEAELSALDSNYT